MKRVDCPECGEQVEVMTANDSALHKEIEVYVAHYNRTGEVCRASGCKLVEFVERGGTAHNGSGSSEV